VRIFVVESSESISIEMYWCYKSLHACQKSWTQLVARSFMYLLEKQYS